MTPNLTPDIAALPLYQLGFHNGQDVGTRVALDAICSEMNRQDDARAIAVVTDPQSVTASRHEHTAGRLLAVAQIIGARFRQVST
jgi:hypothetical protein